jgi:putative transcriptional regulator
MMTGRLFDEMAQGLSEAVAITRGEADPKTYRVHLPDEVDVGLVRRGLGLTQASFAAKFGFSISAVRDWEQRRRRPDRSARLLLKLVEREPEAVARVLAAE